VQTGIDIIGTAMEGLAGIIELAFAPVEKAYKAWLHVTGQTPGPVTGAGARKYEDALADAQARADAARKRASNYRGGRGAWYDPNAAYQGSARQTAIDNDRFKKEKEAAKKAADAKKRADEEAKRQAEATKARGAQLAQGFEKPIETLNRKMKELEGLVRAGAIPREFAMRAAAAYTKEFVTNRAGPKKPYELAGAAEQGSAEAFAALMEVKTDQNNKTAETQRDDMIMIFNSVRDRLNDIFNRLDAGKV
jgi:hypothetical protein